MPPLLSNVCEDYKISMGLSFFPSKIIDELGTFMATYPWLCWETLLAELRFYG